MASRRIRIKGIANIPQRKKNPESVNSDSILTNSDCSFKEEVSDEVSQPVDVSLGPNSSISSCESIKTSPSSAEQPSDVKCIDNDTNLNDYLVCPKAKVTQSNLKVVEISSDRLIKTEISEIPPIEISINTGKEASTQSKEVENLVPVNNVPRRKFLKPGININAVRKRQTTKEVTGSTIENTARTEGIKQDISDEKVGKTSDLISSEKVVVISEIRISKFDNKSLPVARDITKIVSRESNNGNSLQGSVCSEITLNETHLGVSECPIVNSSVVTFSPNIKKVVPETHYVSDSEYPPPPPSPSKINRSRIKAIPRLSQRKTSCSASESEDETRKYGRIRNNSICSVISTTCLEPPTLTSEAATPKDVTPNLPKKLSRTEQSRKVAEARREFHKRFGSNSPDKQRLKMIDLIFYNPRTNPMSKQSSKPSSDISKAEKESEENVDDPSKVIVVEEKEKEKDGENGMPVPQIKIGPSGEIILDEQSLIVENAEVARQKEQIKNSQLVNGDFDTGYGIYKRARRALTWNQKETLRFYKALNLIGTDFTVMTQLFPKRTRRELKIKFKKEEKINKQLVDKAIMQPCNYNFADLKRDIQIEEEEEAALQKIKEEEMEKMKQAQMEKVFKRKKKRKAEANKSITEDPSIPTDPDKDAISLPPKKRLKDLQKPMKPKPQARKTNGRSLNIKSVLDDDSDAADISDMETQSESEEEETIPFLKPTRSGRMPKSTERFTTIVDQSPNQYLYDSTKATPDEPSVKEPSTKTFTRPAHTVHSIALRNRRSSSVSSVDSNHSEKLVPGAVVITMEEDPSGKSEYKVFMVTPDKKMVPLDLNSEIVEKLINEHDKNGCEDDVAPPVSEENVTIPASDENDILQEDEDHGKVVAPPVSEENVTIPASNENDKSKSAQEVLLMNYLDPDETREVTE